MRFLAELEQDLERRASSGLLRTRHTIGSAQGAHVEVDGRPMLAFASNDYLGLAPHLAIIAAMAGVLRDWGAGAGASHLLAGHFAPHDALEHALAQFVAPWADASALLF